MKYKFIAMFSVEVLTFGVSSIIGANTFFGNKPFVDSSKTQEIRIDNSNNELSSKQYTNLSVLINRGIAQYNDAILKPNDIENTNFNTNVNRSVISNTQNNNQIGNKYRNAIEGNIVETEENPES